MELTVDATIVSTGLRTTMVVHADETEVTLAVAGETYALAPNQVEQLRAALGQAEATRSHR